MNGFAGIGLVILCCVVLEERKYSWQHEINTIVYLEPVDSVYTDSVFVKCWPRHCANVFELSQRHYTVCVQLFWYGVCMKNAFNSNEIWIMCSYFCYTTLNGSSLLTAMRLSRFPYFWIFFSVWRDDRFSYRWAYFWGEPKAFRIESHYYTINTGNTINFLFSMV